MLCWQYGIKTLYHVPATHMYKLWYTIYIYHSAKTVHNRGIELFLYVVYNKMLIQSSVYWYGKFTNDTAMVDRDFWLYAVIALHDYRYVFSYIRSYLFIDLGKLFYESQVIDIYHFLYWNLKLWYHCEIGVM